MAIELGIIVPVQASDGYGIGYNGACVGRRRKGEEKEKKKGKNIYFGRFLMLQNIFILKSFW